MILKYDFYNETIEEHKKTELELQMLKERLREDFISMKQQMKEDIKKQVLELLLRLKLKTLVEGL